MATDKNFTIKNGLNLGSTEIIDSSGNVDGRDVSADGNKLDGIATGADVTPSWVPSSDPSYLTSADGGNADTVDSLHASSFLRSDANDSASGTLTLNGEVISSRNVHNYFRIESSNTSEAMIRYNNSTSNLWYTGIRATTSNGLGTSDYHIYSSAAGQSVLGVTAAGTAISKNQGTLWGSSNDGSGSGLDADLLDGLDSTAFQKISDKEFFSITNSGTTAGTWLGSHDDVSSYFDGMTIAFYQNNLAGAATTTLNINDLGAKTIYYANDSKLTTHYGARTLIMLQYDSQQDRFYAHDFFYSDSNFNLRWDLDFTVNNSAGTGVAVHGYQMLIEGTDGKFYPCTEGGSSANTNSVSTVDLKIGGTMLMYNTSTDYNANATLTSSAVWAALETSTMEYWNNRDSGWATADRPIYFVGTVQSNGSFQLDNTSYTSFLTQDLPTTDDGKIYIKIGWMANTYDSFRLENNHPIYVYKDGSLKEYAGYAEYAGDADTVDGLQASQFLRSDANDTTSGNLTVAGGELLVNKVRCNSGQQLVLNAGEANNAATGQTDELVYMNAEAGVQINTSTDNWVGGWANRKTTTITGTRITVDGNYWEADDDTWNKFYTTHGYIQLGPANANHGHIYTDRPSFYFNKPLIRSGATVWDSANDGAGSGLHADLLDGQHGSYYRPVNESLFYKSTREAAGSYLNLNAATTPGIYRLHSASNHTGHPTGSGYGFNIVLDNTDVHGHILLDRLDGGTMHIRAKSGTTWTTSEWNKVWTDGNDGAGSGLDADLLDGQEGSYYLNYNNLSNVPTIPGNPAITSNGSTPSLASGITAAEVRSLIGAGTSSFDGTYGSISGTPTIPANPAITTNGSIPSLASNITGAEVRSLIGAGTSSLALGTTSTTALAGNTSIPSALTDLSITDGTNGQVLTTDGSGSFTFGDGGINTTLTTYNFTATSNQTTFSGADSNGNTLGYATGNLIVSVNGVVHRNGVEYTATNGTSVVFSSGLETSDEVSIVTFTVIDLTNIDYSNVNNTPSLATVATSGSYSDLSGTPSLSTVATSGSYTNLSNTPLAYDSVGSYLLGYVNGPSNSGPGDFLPGQTLAGSFIRPAGIRLGADPTSEFNSDDEAAGGINAVTYRGDYVPSGTWRVMGNLDRGDNQTANWARFTLFVRIS
jgi:hypothetical protein